MRITRGNHLRTAWQSLRLFTMVLAAATATLSLHKTLAPTAAAEADIEPVVEEQAQPEPLAFTAGTPASSTPSDVKPANAILKWTATGTGTQEDTYDVRLGTTAEVDTNSGELLTPTHSENGLSVPQYDATALAEGTYYWQVRSCGLVACNSWSPVWNLVVDATAPAEPTAAVTSDAYDQTVILAGSAEAGSAVSVTVGDLNCTTTVLEDSTWSCQFGDEFDFGDYSALIKTIDKAGNESSVLTVEFAVKELFVASQITAEELPVALEIVPADVTPENKVFQQPVTSVIDVVNTGTATDSDELLGAAVTPLSTDGGIVQSSENGWQVLGLPWFIWLGSMAGITGGWWAFGAPVPRRLGSLLSL